MRQATPEIILNCGRLSSEMLSRAQLIVRMHLLRPCHELSGTKVSDAWWSNPFRGRGKWNASAVDKQYGLVLIGHAFMHYWAVAVTLQVCFQTLHFTTPHHITHLAAWDRPSCEILEMGLCSHCRVVRDEIHKSVAESSKIFEVCREIYKPVCSVEALCVQHVQQSFPRVIVWEITEHQRCPVVVFKLLLHDTLHHRVAIDAPLWERR